jgi:helicase
MIDINDMNYNLDIKSSIIQKIESGEVIECNLVPFLKYLSEERLSDKPICLHDNQEAGTFVDISKIFIKDLEIHSMLKKYYEDKKINELLPIQKIAIREGLLNNQNLLVVSSTSSGKTLLGEISGFNKILNGKGKMLYLLPLVALATMRFDEYNEIPQSMGIKPILKVGESKFSEEKKEIQKYNINESNLIVATYESIDTLLRREISLGLVDTIVVDEIQVLATDGRGYILDGMIARLKSIYPSAQFIFLSATISDPKLLSDHYGCKLIEYKGNSVPLERFIVLNENESNKINKIAKLVTNESKNLSSTGFKGQSLIFTNSRQKCETLAANLIKTGINAVAFHSGLSSKEKKIIQDLFKKQDISCIVATEALAAGIDTACSLVIFETITMGIENITVTAFKQMCGRAGRYGKHDLAYVVIFTNYTYLNNLINLLSGKLEPIRLI